jgi:phosphohistidine swiveling domain-containing protein
LKGYPQQVQEEFNRLLEAAQKGTVLTEDHGFWIDYSSMYRVRQVIMELGRRFAAAGVIDGPDDILHLSREEVQMASKDLASADVKGLIVTRKDEIRYFEHSTPPPILGTDHGPPPDNFVMRAMGKFFGVPPEVSEDADILQGHAGSPGKTQGAARLLEASTDGHKLNPGDVLVAQTTATPVDTAFATAGAIVTDTGGVLSHCAVVAREYGIPAVVGTQLATSRIQDGQLVEVDGDRGIVRILS